MKHLRLLMLALLLSVVCSCDDNKVSTSAAPLQEGSSVTPQSTQGSSNGFGSTGNGTLHTDPNYKYQYRTGTSGNYEYNYDVSGSDENGDEVSGNIDISGKYGNGTITDENGDDHDVDVEWVDYGKLEATDENNNTYELEVE